MARFLTKTKLSFAISAPWVVFMERPQRTDTGLTGLLKPQSTSRKLISIRNSLLPMSLKRKSPILASRLPFASTILKRDLTLTAASHFSLALSCQPVTSECSQCSALSLLTRSLSNPSSVRKSVPWLLLALSLTSGTSALLNTPLNTSKPNPRKKLRLQMNSNEIKDIGAFQIYAY